MNDLVGTGNSGNSENQMIVTSTYFDKRFMGLSMCADVSLKENGKLVSTNFKP